MKLFRKPRPSTTAELFSDQIQDYLAEARNVAENVARRRGTVTMDDVLAELPRPEYVVPRRLCHLFNFDPQKRFRLVGHKKSNRTKVSKSHAIGVWTLRKEWQ